MNKVIPQIYIIILNWNGKEDTLEGVKDYFLRKFGNCPEWVRSPVKQ